MRKLFRALISLLALAAVVAGAAGYWYVTRGDEFLRQKALVELNRLSPQLAIKLERANFDLYGRIRLAGLLVNHRETGEPLAKIPEVVVTVDRQQLLNDQKIVMRQVRFLAPEFFVQRNGNSWNWAGVTFRQKRSVPLPEFALEHGRARLQMLLPDGTARDRMMIDAITAQVAPGDGSSIGWQVQARIDPAGPVDLQGTLTSDFAPVNVAMSWKRIPVDDSLVALVEELIPESRELTSRGRELLRLEAARQATIAYRREERRQGRETEAEIDPASVRPLGGSFGIETLADLEVSWGATNHPAGDWRARVQFSQGRIDHTLLPWKISGLRGVASYEQGQLRLADVSWSAGETTFIADAVISQAGGLQLKFDGEQLALDESLKTRLPWNLAKAIDEIGLTGVLRGGGIVQRPPGGAWQYRLNGEMHDGALVASRFPLPIHSVVGTATLTSPDERSPVPLAVFEGNGLAGSSPVRFEGWARNPGPESEAFFDITAENYASDRAFLLACPPTLRRVLEDLRFQGRGHGRIQLHRPPGLGQKFYPHATVTLVDASVDPSYFRYRLDRLQGEVTWDGHKVNCVNMTAEHGGTRLTGFGSYQPERGPAELELSISATGAEFDQSLYLALPENLQTVWQDLDLGGRFDLNECLILWSAGRAVDVRIPSLKIADGRMTLRHWPLPITGIRGEVGYDQGQLTIRELSGQHEQTRLLVQGKGWFAPNDPWSLQFDRMLVDDLTPNPPFRRTLPSQLREVLDQLNPTGTVSLEGSSRLWATDASSTIIAGNWKTKLHLHRCGLNAGQRLEEIGGVVDQEGSYDGRDATISGRLAIDSVVVLGHQLSNVQGPFRYENGRFVAGSIENLPEPRAGAQPPPPRSEHITADAVGGKVLLDAEVFPEQGPRYRALLAINGGSLEKYAQRYLRGYSAVAGLMNGWMFVHGTGPREDQVQGHGTLMIYPAALFDLPIFVQIFSAMRFQPPDRAAFDYANLVFTLADSRFNFESIDLFGKSISFRGRGYVRFDGAMSLDFYSRMGGRTALPLVNTLIGAATSDWVRILVRGNINAPVARQEALPELTDTFRNFLLAPFAPRPAGGPIPTFRSSDGQPAGSRR